jgi:replicative DNA helicase
MEDMILEKLITDETYSNRAIEVIQERFFSGEDERRICQLIKNHWARFSRKPTWDSLFVEAAALHVSEEVNKQINDKLEHLREQRFEVDSEWLIDSTQAWLKNRSVFMAVKDAIFILEGHDKKQTIDSLPQLFENSLSVSLDQSIGHDYFRDAEEQYEYYHSDEVRLPTGIKMFDLITKGGPSRGTFNIFMSTQTGGFKTGTKCHMSANYLMAGKNVAYFSMEMSEQKIRERIDANLLKIDIDNLESLPKDAYLSRISKLKELTHGNLKIKQFPTSSTHVGHMRFLLKQWKAQDGFVPDVIIVDYVNICASQRLKSDAGSFFLIKAIGEELRGLAVEWNAVMWSSTQSNRGGFSSGEDINIDDTSESFGLPNSLDLFLGIITSVEMDARGLIMFKQLKNRYGPITEKNIKFPMGIHKAQMRLHDLSTEDPREQFKENREKAEAVKKLTHEKPPEKSFDTWKF